jgi:hypothetical protein
MNKDNYRSFTPKQSEEWLIANGYIYNEVFGWETMAIIERFNLNPEMKGVPCELQPMWEEVESKETIIDEFGNKQKTKGAITWVRSKTKMTWYPTDNWLAYTSFKKERNRQRMAETSIPLPRFIEAKTF